MVTQHDSFIHRGPGRARSLLGVDAHPPGWSPFLLQPTSYRKLGQVQEKMGKTLDEMCEHTSATLHEGPYSQDEIAAILKLSAQGEDADPAKARLLITVLADPAPLPLVQS